MALLREAELGDFLGKRSGEASGLLIHGANQAGVEATVQTVVKALGANDHVRRIAAAELRGSSGIVEDAVRSLSLLGGRELVLVEGCEETHAPAILPIMTGTLAGNFLLLAAGYLKKTSELKRAAEESRFFFSLAVRDEQPGDTRIHVRRHLGAHGLKFSEEAETIFAELCGTDRALALNEAEKLTLYCAGAAEVTAEDVLACCGDQANYGIDQVVDAVLDGDAAAADRRLTSLGEGGWRSVLPVLSGHLARLTALRATFDTTGDADAVVRNARPFIFSNRKSAVMRQLRQLEIEDLIRFQGNVEDCVLRTRQHADLSEQLAGRLLLSLAVETRRLTHR